MGTTKQSKRGRQMLVMFAVLILLVSVWIFLRDHPVSDEEESSGETQVSVADVDTDSVVKIEKTYQGETLSFVLEDDVWYYEPDKEFPLVQEYLTNMASAVSSMSASRILRGDEIDSEAFGLENPELTVTITDSKGNTYTYYVGKKNEVTDMYYMKKGSGDEVYLIGDSVFYYYSDALYDMCDMDEIPDVSESNVEGLTVQENGSQYSLARTQITKTDEDGNETTENQWTGILNGDGKETCSGTAVSSLVSAALAFYNIGGIDYKGTETGLETYGLDDPWGVVTVRYLEEAETGETDEDGNAVKEKVQKVYSVYIGAEYDGDSYYAKLSNSDMVFLLEKEKVSAVFDVDFESLVQK